MSCTTDEIPSSVRNNVAAIILSDNSPGSGEMKTRIREFDWSKTQLGPLETWPISLLSNLSFLLASRLPMIMYWNTNKIALYNDAYIPILSNKHPNALGLPAIELWKEVWTELKPIFETCYAGNPVYAEDTLFFFPRNGYLEEAYFTYSINPVMNEQGIVGGMMIQVVEVTRRILAERRLNLLSEAFAKTNKTMATMEEACTLYSTIFETLPVDIPFSLLYLMDTKKKVLTLQSISGYKEDTLPEQIPKIVPVSNLVSENQLEQLLQQVLISKEEIVQIKNPIQYLGMIPNGVWNEIPSLAVAINLESAGVLLIGINTRRTFDTDYQHFVELLASQLSKAMYTTQAYEYEKKKAQELIKLDEAKNAFFANISHEFRTPLTLILTGLEQIDKNNLSISHQETFSVITRNSKRLLKLVNMLLEFSRIEAGRVDMCFQPIEIVEYTKTLASLFESVIKKEGLEFAFHSEGIDELVYIDIAMWDKIILNLLSNAFKFTLEGKIEIQIQKDTTKRNVQVRIVDSGVGVDELEIPNLFKRFHRLPYVKGRSFEGSGIGLALVQELVKYHGGTIQVESQLDKGTTFIISIPLGKKHLPLDKIKEMNEVAEITVKESSSYFVEEATQWSTTHSTSPLKQTATSNCTILIVDDNIDVRQYIMNILSPYFKIHLCSDGVEAYSYTLKHVPDLILSDVMMPNMNGFELIQKLRSHEETNLIPVILLSARASEEAKIDGLHCGAVDYLVKTSLSAKELVTRINGHLELSKLRISLKEQVKKTNQMVTELKQTKITQEEFIDTVCHEIRNPLAGILGSSEVIQEIITTCQQLIQEKSVKELETYIVNHISLLTNCIQNIQECVMHQTMIANDVLSLSKLEAGKIDINSSIEQVSSLIKSCVELFTSKVKEKQIEIICQVSDQLTITIDARKFKQIVINLLSNALKFSHPNKCIWIIVNYSDGMLQTCIKDEGKGMSPEEQSQLFHRFSQVHQSMGHSYEGFGLGLSICSKLVNLFGGTITVQSIKNKGTTFTFTIPCILSSTTTTMMKPTSPILPSNKNTFSIVPFDKPVLIVEDNAINQNVLKRMLTIKGITCEVASNGKQALDLYAPNKYAIVFMDITMPEMNGLEATRKIRQMEQELMIANVPIVGLSGNAKREQKELGLQMGMNDYIIKPVHSETVLQMINKYCCKL